MKLTINTSALKAALTTLKPICKASTTYPILSNVCIAAEKDSITLLGMDGEKQLSIKLDCKVKEKGATTLSCSKLLDATNATGAECLIESKDEQATVRVGRAVTRILGLPISEMVEQVKINEGEGVMIPAVQFNELMGFSLLHASTDETKALLNSVILLSRNGKLNFQASDFKHLVICATELSFEESGFFIIPRDSVPPLVKMSTEGELELLFGDNSMSVKYGPMEFRTKLLESERIPEFESAFPADLSLKVTCNKSELEEIVKYAQLGTSEQNRGITLSCDGSIIVAQGHGAVISSENQGFFEDFMNETKCKDGSAKFKTNLNPQYLRDAIACVKSDEITIELTDNPKKPLVIREDGMRVFICPMFIA